jgi:hypothetical protein
MFTDKNNGIGMMNGNFCLFKYWMKDNKINYSKYPFEISPNLMPTLFNGFKLLNTILKN